MKYTKNEQDVQHLQRIQLELLNSVAPLLKKGGILVYSTCTVDDAENASVIEKFLNENKKFSGDHTLAERLPKAIKALCDRFSIQILPQDFGSDGFYIAALKKTE